MRKGNFTQVDNEVISRIAEIGHTPFAVYVVLARHADEKGECFPSQTHVADVVGVSVRSVERAVGKLKNLGLVGVRQRRQKTAIYRILRTDTSGGSWGLRTDTTDIKNRHLRPLRPDTSGGGNKTQEQYPIIRPANEETSKPSKRKTYSEPFSRWWQAYPKRVDKVEAAKAFAKTCKSLIADDDHPTITTADEAVAFLTSQAESYVESLNGTDPKYIKHAATWLNKGSYDDEVTTTTTTSIYKSFEPTPGDKPDVA